MSTTPSPSPRRSLLVLNARGEEGMFFGALYLELNLNWLAGRVINTSSYKTTPTHSPKLSDVITKSRLPTTVFGMGVVLIGSGLPNAVKGRFVVNSAFGLQGWVWSRVVCRIDSAWRTVYIRTAEQETCRPVRTSGRRASESDRQIGFAKETDYSTSLIRTHRVRQRYPQVS